MKRLPPVIDRIENISVKVGGIIAAVAIWVILVLTVGEIVIRKIFHGSIVFSVEFIEYALAISIMYIVADLARRRGHLVVDVLATRFTGKTRRIMNLIFYLISFFLYSVIITYLMYRMASESYLMEVKAYTVQETPLWIPQLVIMPGLLLLCFVLLLDIIRWFLPGEAQGATGETGC